MQGSLFSGLEDVDNNLALQPLDITQVCVKNTVQAHRTQSLSRIGKIIETDVVSHSRHALP